MGGLLGGLSKLFGGRKDTDHRFHVKRVKAAQRFMANDHTALYRQYHVDEAKRIIKQCIGVDLSDEEAVTAINGLRYQHGLGEIPFYHMPGYREGK